MSDAPAQPNRDNDNDLLQSSDLEGLFSEEEKKKAGFDDASQPEAGTLADASQPENEGKGIKNILEMKIPVIVKIAEKKMRMENVLKLNLGSVVQFDKDAYQLIDLMVNNETIGMGQPIKIGEKFGLQVTHLGDITDTIRKMGKKFEP